MYTHLLMTTKNTLLEFELFELTRVASHCLSGALESLLLHCKSTKYLICCVLYEVTLGVTDHPNPQLAQNKQKAHFCIPALVA